MIFERITRPMMICGLLFSAMVHVRADDSKIEETLKRTTDATASKLPLIEGLNRLKYNHPGLVVDLGVGLWAWPVPCDADGDGDMDLIVSCPDKPYNGTYLFENPSGNHAIERDAKLPVFGPARRLSNGSFNVTPSYVGDSIRVTTPGFEHPDFLTTGLAKSRPLGLAPDPIQRNPDFIRPHQPGAYKTRHNQWKYADLNGDNQLDLVVAIELWSEYGWDDAWDSQGRWTHGPLRAVLYRFMNRGTSDAPSYDEPILMVSESDSGTDESQPISPFGLASPNFVDFDADGDLDLLCGEFLDGFTYYENSGTGRAPQFSRGKRLRDGGHDLKMDLQMIVPVAFDWDRDGDYDLIVGDEDGRVALVENTGNFSDRVPVFLPPQYFKQESDDLKFGALATTYGFDWDGDEDIDIIAGNTAGHIGFIENLSGPGIESPSWLEPRKLSANGKVIRITAGPNGSIQGPAEAKWGYTTQSVADWDLDGLPDLIVNSIWGKVIWYRNVGTRTKPLLAEAAPIEVQWQGPTPKPEWTWWNPNGLELVTQWRTTPIAVDWNLDGLTDLVMLDHEGFLSWFERRRMDDQLILMPGKRVLVDADGNALRLNSKRAGASGRRKLCIVDWDGDGRQDILVNGVNANWLRQTGHREGKWYFEDRGALDSRKIEGHDTSPTTVDWNGDTVPDLLVGAEDGRFYYLCNERKPNGGPTQPLPQIASSEFIYETAPFPSCHASTIEESTSGLVAAWFGGTREKHPDVGIWVSRLENGKWSAPEEVANGIQSDTKRYPCWNPVLFQPHLQPGGSEPTDALPLLLFYKVGPDPESWWGMLTTSSDGGKHWTAPRRLPEPFVGPIKNKPIQLANGDILCGSSTEFDGWRIHMERTSDLGLTWQSTGPLHDGKEIGAIQPSLLTYPNGRLRAVGRTQDSGKVYEIWSEDSGQTWGTMKLTELPNPNSGTDAVTLRSGAQWIVYNHTTKGRSPLNVAIADGEVHWKSAITLESEPGEYSYPAIIQTRDGLVHITYTWKRQRIKHVVIKP